MEINQKFVCYVKMYGNILFLFHRCGCVLKNKIKRRIVWNTVNKTREIKRYSTIYRALINTVNFVQFKERIFSFKYRWSVDKSKDYKMATLSFNRTKKSIPNNKHGIGKCTTHRERI